MRCLILLLILIVLFSCKSNVNKSNNIFHYNETTGIASLDPAFSRNQSTMWPAHQLFNTLVEDDGHNGTKGSLAKSWELSADATEYTFHIRSDIYFHDHPVFPEGKGRRMTAHDIAYSFSRIIDPAVASPGNWIFNNVVDSITPFVAKNDSTFLLRLLRPYAPILHVLKMKYCSVVPREVVEKHGKDFRRNPCGTGPFQFVAWEEGLALVLKKNPNYFESDSNGNRLPYLDGIKITFNESKAAEFLLFRQGKLDFLNDIDASFKDEILTLKGTLRDQWNGQIVLQTHPYLNTEYFGVLVDSNNALLANSPLKSRLVRQAINYAIDRRKMILYLRNSLSTPAESGFIPQGMPSFDSSEVAGYHYDPARSRQLLADAGFPGGAGLPVISLYTIPIYGEIANYIARQLEEVGIRVKIDIVLRSVLFDLTSNSKALFFRGSWIADYADAINYLAVFYSKNPAPPNYTRYKNQEFDKLYEQSLTEPNDSLRFIIYRKADALVMRDAPVIPLWYDRVIRIVQPNIQGFLPNNLNMLELRTTRKTNR